MFKWNENRNIIKIDINYVKQVKYGMKASVIVTTIVSHVGLICSSLLSQSLIFFPMS